MHGSSVLKICSRSLTVHGGKILVKLTAYPLKKFKKGIKRVRKVNIDTDNRLAITAAVREAF